MDSAKNGRRIIPFKKFGMVRVNTFYIEENLCLDILCNTEVLLQVKLYAGDFFPDDDACFCGNSV